MTETARLSSTTTIERDEYGTAWIVTSDHVVAVCWLLSNVEGYHKSSRDDGEWSREYPPEHALELFEYTEGGEHDQ
jgi:hypothetical protein